MRIKDHILDYIIAILGLIIAALDYFNIGPEKVVQALNSISVVVYVLAGVLIGWGGCRIFYDMKFKTKSMRKKEARADEEMLRADFVKRPYWIKVFLRAVLEKEHVFSKANNFAIECELEFLLLFVDYKTVGHNELQFSMRKKARDFFEKNVQLLDDVKDEDIRFHARNSEGMYYMHDLFQSPYQGLDWWYFSDEDYVEPSHAEDLDDNPVD